MGNVITISCFCSDTKIRQFKKNVILMILFDGVRNPPFAVWTQDVWSLPWDARVNTSQCASLVTGGPTPANKNIQRHKSLKQIKSCWHLPLWQYKQDGLQSSHWDCISSLPSEIQKSFPFSKWQRVEHRSAGCFPFHCFTLKYFHYLNGGACFARASHYRIATRSQRMAWIWSDLLYLDVSPWSGLLWTGRNR